MTPQHCGKPMYRDLNHDDLDMGRWACAEYGCAATIAAPRRRDCTPATCVFAQLYVDVQRVLDEVLGSDNDDDVEGGIEGEVRRALAWVRVAERKRVLREVAESGLVAPSAIPRLRALIGGMS